jgi:predicted glutamine amidotransferase
MCRLLYIRSNSEFTIGPHLRVFSEICENSKEYQGHGWGCAYLVQNEWKLYRNLKPIWEDDFSQFSETKLFIAHARSAFRDQDIILENNMPFFKNGFMFIFNGELHGVRINSNGKSGAEKIFNFLLRLDQGNTLHTLQKAMKIIEKRSRYIRAFNMIMANKESAFLASYFNEDPDYFAMYHKHTSSEVLICSEPYPEEHDWKKIENRTIEVF